MPPEDLPEQTIALELPVRSIVDWQLDQTKKAQLAADDGNLQLAADLCEALMNEDGRIRGPLAQRTSVLRLDPIITPGSGPRAAAAAKQIDPKENGGLHDELFGGEEFEKIHRWGLVLGVCPYRKNWWEDGKARIRNGINVPALEFWHPRNLRFEWSSREWKLALEGTQEITITPDGPEFGLYLPYGERRPWAEGLWRALKLYWICGLLTFEDWNRANEKLGIGAFVAKAPDGVKQDDPVIRKVARELKALGREKAFALPVGWLLELIESKGQTAQSFEKLIELTDTCKAITILGQNLTTEVKGGSYAATTAHKAVSHDVIARDERIIRGQKGKILKSWATVVHGSPDAAPVVALDITPPEDDKARVDAWNVLGDATTKLVSVGYAVDLDKAAALVKLPTTGPSTAKIPAAPADPAAKTQPPPKGFRAMGAAQVPDTAFARGREYIDRLEGECCAHAAKGLAPMVASLASAIEKATGYSEALELTTERYRDELPPSKLVTVTEAMLILGQLAGRETVEQEIATED